MLYQEKLNQFEPNSSLHKLWVQRSQLEQEGFLKWMDEVMDSTVMEYIQTDKPILHLYQYLRGSKGQVWSWKGQALLQADIESMAHYIKHHQIEQ